MPEEIIRKMLEAGFRVYMRNPNDSYLIYSDDLGRIAYLQYSRLAGVEISTMHKPVPTIGSGFALSVPQSLDRAELERGFIIAPNWARTAEQALVRKYSSMAEFQNASNWNASFIERV